jgi:hypothetical protein
MGNAMSEVKKYRKKPVVIEAFEVRHLDTPTARQVAEWCPNAFIRPSDNHLVISTLEGDMTVSSGDFIIKGVNGEFYPCKPDIFAKTYEVA